MAKKKDKPQIATMHSPTIEAIVGEMFYFQSIEQAKKRLNVVKKMFICTPCDEEEGTDKTKTKGGGRGGIASVPKLRMWIKGYEVTDEEGEKGYIGNFADIGIKRDSSDGYYTLYAMKVPVDISQHPQKRRGKLPHPDWGHPVLRAVKSGKLYDSIEEVQSCLDRLMVEYPDVCIPSKNRLYIIIYEKSGKRDEIPVKKYILEIKIDREGKFFIEARENIRISVTAPSVEYHREHSADAENDSAPGILSKPKKSRGYFSSLVMLKSKRK